MNFVLERVTQPEIEPVTLAEAKRHIRQFVNVTTEDADTEALIQVAREWVEDYTGRAMIDQTWRLNVRPDSGVPIAGDSVSGYSSRPGYYGTMNWLAEGGIYLRRSPVLSILSVATVDAEGVETVLDEGSYLLWNAASKYPILRPRGAAAWNANSTFRVEFRAGFADQLGSPVTGAEVVPAALKHAMKLIIANFDSTRESVNVGNIVTKMPNGIEWLLSSQKCELGMA